MALLFCDGFDWTSENNRLTQKGWVVYTDYIPTGSGYSRTVGGNGANKSGGTPYMYRTFANTTTAIVGFAINIRPLSTATQIFYFKDAVGTQVAVDYDSTSNRFHVYSGSYASLLGSTPVNSVIQDTWYYVEIKSTINNTTGTLVFRINEVTHLNLTNVDTQGTANAFCTTVFWGDENGSGVGSSPNFWLDDVYVCDTTGSYCNDFLGDVQISTLWPASDSSPLQWAATPGATHYSGIDDQYAVAQTDFITASVSGYRDQFGMGNLPVTPTTVHAVAVSGIASKLGSGAKSYKQYIKSSSSETISGSIALSLGSDLQTQTIVERDPNGPAAWTGSSVNAAEIGVEVV